MAVTDLTRALSDAESAGARPAYAQLPLVVDEHGRHWLTGFDEVIQSWDLTFGTKSEDADYVVGQTWARRGSQVYLVDQVRDRLDYPEQVAAVEAARGKWPQVRGQQALPRTLTAPPQAPRYAEPEPTREGLLWPSPTSPAL